MIRSSIAATARLLEQIEPSAFGSPRVLIAEFGGQRGTDRDQIVAGVETFGDLADVLAERLAIPQVQ